MNLMGFIFLLSKFLYQYGYFIRVSAMCLGGYSQVARVTFGYCKQYLRRLCEPSLEVPSWAITDDLYELSLTVKGQPCKVLVRLASTVPKQVMCEDGLDVTNEVLPYLKVAPVQFTSEVYGEPLQKVF